MYDVVVIGGGPIGALAALILNQFYPKVLLLEQRPLHAILSAKASRTLALNVKSLNLLNYFGFNHLLEHLCPIEQVHISVKGHVNTARIKASSHGLKQLGGVIDQHVLEQGFYKRVLETNVEITQGSLSQLKKIDEGFSLSFCCGDNKHSVKTKICFVTDGANSKAREQLGIGFKETDFYQTATAGVLAFNRAHHNVAFEQFTDNGAVALLPMQDNKATFVWTQPTEQALITKEASDDAFLQLLAEEFKRLRLFKPQLAFKTQIPLKSVIADTQYDRNILLLGNAAHSLHPIAAQGFNLSLRDLNELSSLLKQGLSLDELSQRYVKNRLPDQQAIEHYTYFLASMVGTSKLPGWLKALGLGALDNIPMVKHQLSTFNLGVAS